MLRTIDTNSYKQGLDLSKIDFDAIITKATGGTGYVDPTCDPFVQQAISLNKKWGVFHYFNDGFGDNDPIAEADFFVNNCLGYLGKGTIWLDWERGGNPVIDRVDIALAWLEHVRTRTGVKPSGIYMSLSTYQSYDWSPVINAGYALGCADYVKDNEIIPNFQMPSSLDPNPRWDGTVGDVLWQFTSCGRLDGYDGNLDCSFFYGAAASWDAYASVHTAPAPDPTPVPQPSPPPQPEPTPDPVPMPSPEPIPSPAPDPPVDNPSPEPTPVPEPTPTPPPEPDVSVSAKHWYDFILNFLAWLVS